MELPLTLRNKNRFTRIQQERKAKEHITLERKEKKRMAKLEKQLAWHEQQRLWEKTQDERQRLWRKKQIQRRSLRYSVWRGRAEERRFNRVLNSYPFYPPSKIRRSPAVDIKEANERKFDRNLKARRKKRRGRNKTERKKHRGNNLKGNFRAYGAERSCAYGDNESKKWLKSVLL